MERTGFVGLANRAFDRVTPAPLTPLFRDLRSRAAWKFRGLTWRARPLPDFLIIGAQKSGTTSLYYYLSQHPQIRPSLFKEVNFFNSSGGYEKGPAWYRSHFPMRIMSAKQPKTFEATPEYLFYPEVPQRIHALLPQVRLIALLRNPSERAVSQYFHWKRKGRETVSPYEAICIEMKRVEVGDQSSEDKTHRSVSPYIGRGRYKEQLERYLKYFTREQLLVVQSETFFRETSETLKSIFAFIGVNTHYEDLNLRPVHVSPNKHQVDAEVYDCLDAYYRPYNEALYELLGTSYDW